MSQPEDGSIPQSSLAASRISETEKRKTRLGLFSWQSLRETTLGRTAVDTLTKIETFGLSKFGWKLERG
jgi:hypothetical protein